MIEAVICSGVEIIYRGTIDRHSIQQMDELSGGLEIVDLKRQEDHVEIAVAQSNGVPEKKLRRVRTIIDKSPAEVAVIFGSKALEVDIALIYSPTWSREQLVHSFSQTLRHIRKVWPGAPIISMNRFSPDGSSGETLHLLAYRGVGELIQFESPLLREAICVTGEFIKGQFPSTGHSRLDKDSIDDIRGHHRSELSLAMVDCLTAPRGYRAQLIAKYCEYHARHMLVSMCRVQLDGKPGLYTRLGLIYRILCVVPELAEPYWRLVVESRRKSPMMSKIAEASTLLLDKAILGNE